MLQIVLFAIVISELMLSSWPAIIVACDHRGLRTADVKQDFPSRAVSQVLSARSAATALAVSFSDPERTSPP
jgi:hypothetical protein